MLYLRQWLAAFPPGAVLVLRLEDYAALASTPAEMAEAGPSGRLGAARALRRVFDHLGLPQPPAAAAGEAAGGWWAAALGAPVARGSHPREATPQRSPPAGIDPAVRSRVAAFYAPFDAELEALLGVNGFARWHTPLPG